MADHNSTHGYPGPLATRGPMDYVINDRNEGHPLAPPQAPAALCLRIPVPAARVILCALRTAQRAAGGNGGSMSRSGQIRAVADDLEGMILTAEETGKMNEKIMERAAREIVSSLPLDSMDSER